MVYNGDLMPSLNHTFALSQAWRCASKLHAHEDPRTDSKLPADMLQWDSCDKDKVDHHTEISVMGYSMRTIDYRYTMYIPFKRPHRLPIWDESIYDEELYDHRGETGLDFGHREHVNLARDASHNTTLVRLRLQLRDYLWNHVIYENLTSTFSEQGRSPLGRGSSTKIKM